VGCSSFEQKPAVFFIVFKPGGRIVLLHGFMKKSQKTPRRELELALKRMEEI
jgi:phage-related protein